LGEGRWEVPSDEKRRNRCGFGSGLIETKDKKGVLWLVAISLLWEKELFAMHRRPQNPK
jgi:hypothetical protein